MTRKMDMADKESTESIKNIESAERPESWVALTFDDGVARLTLGRGGNGNALSMKMVEDIHDAVVLVEASDAYVLLIDASGSAFCVGGDAHYLLGREAELSLALHELLVIWNRTLIRLSELDIPIVLALQGVVSGGGLGLIACADHVVAGSSTRFVSGFSLLGFNCDSGISWFLPRLIGQLRARQMLLENCMLNADTACSWGLVTEVVADEQLQASANQCVQTFRAASRTAMTAMKQVLRTSLFNDYGDQLSLEKETLKACAEKSDPREGLQAFLQRRKPIFKDR